MQNYFGTVLNNMVSMALVIGAVQISLIFVYIYLLKEILDLDESQSFYFYKTISNDFVN